MRPYRPANPSDPRRRRLPSAHTVLLALGALVLAPVACGDDPTGPNGTTDPDSDGDEPYAHDLAPGASAHDLLADDTFEHLIVQIQYIEGAEPTDEGLTHLEEFLEARLNKPGGIELRKDDAPIASGSGPTYGAADVRDLEEEHRTVYTSGDTLAAYLVFLDGEHEQENVLGIAYNNTSTAIFGEKIREHTGGTFEPDQSMVEGTVANHEFGHIMGLVNNGTEMQEPHQDEDNGHHCDVDSCLMYFSVRTTDFLDNLVGSGEPPDLDRSCLDDLAANGGK